MSKKLVNIENDRVITTSLKVAETFEKKHRNVLADIRGLIKQVRGALKNQQTPMFQETTYIHEQNGQEYPMYLINRDGFTLLAMGFTGEKALKFKLKYINAFNKMEAKLKELLAEDKDTHWLATRQHGKIARKEETNAIKLLIEHAKSQGCTWEDKVFYSQISTWCDIGAGLPPKNGRDTAEIHQLNTLDMLEGTLVSKIIIDNIAVGLHWTRILAMVKQQIAAFLTVTFRNPALLSA